MVNILILYSSKTGHVKNLARYIATGVDSVTGANAVLRTVPQVSTVSEQIAPAIPETGDIYVTPSDLEQCAGLALGSPVRFGNMDSSLKYFLDTTTSLWVQGALVDKPACVFTSSSSLHGGQEACLFSMMIPLLHHGMILLGIPYTNSDLHTTTSGGTPYGVTHYAGPKNDLAISIAEQNLAKAMGVRLATTALKLSK